MFYDNQGNEVEISDVLHSIADFLDEDEDDREDEAIALSEMLDDANEKIDAQEGKLKDLNERADAQKLFNMQILQKLENLRSVLAGLSKI